MRLQVLILIFLHVLLADWTTTLSYRNTDVVKIKCDALPYRTLTLDGKCYFVIDRVTGNAARQDCSRMLFGAQFTDPGRVPDKVWESLFVDQNLFVSDSVSEGKTKAMCTYESPSALEFSNLSQGGVVGNATARLDVMKTMCFRRTTSTVRKVVIESLKVIDEYHCKMICAENKQCFSFIFCTGKCTILGENKADFVCGNEYNEWVKKTTDAECPENIKQPSIDFFGYSPNPALAPPKAIQIDDTRNITLNKLWPCPPSAVIDTTRPDNSHRVEGATCSGVYWDGKLGSWMFVKRPYPVEDPMKIYYYVRSVRCYKADPTKFSDTTKCGGPLPLSKPQDMSPYKSTYPVTRYGAKKVCSSTRDNFACSVDCRPGYEMGFDGDIDNTISCIDGSWIWFDCWGNTAKPTHGFCGVYRN